MNITACIKGSVFCICDQVPRCDKYIVLIKRDGTIILHTYSLSLLKLKYIKKTIEERKQCLRKHIKNTSSIVLEMILDQSISIHQVQTIKQILKQYPCFNELKIYLLYNFEPNNYLFFFESIYNKKQAIGTLNYQTELKNDSVKVLTEQMVSLLHDYRLKLLYENPQNKYFLLPLKIKKQIFNSWKINEETSNKNETENRQFFEYGCKQSRIKGTFITMSDTDTQMFTNSLFEDILPQIPKPNRILFHFTAAIILVLLYSLILFASYRMNMNLVQEFFNSCITNNEKIDFFTHKNVITLNYYEIETQIKQLTINEHNFEENLETFRQAILTIEKKHFWRSILVNSFFLDFSTQLEDFSKKLYCQQYEKLFLKAYIQKSNRHLLECKQNVSEDYDWSKDCVPYIMASKYRIRIIDSFINQDNELIDDIDTWTEQWTHLIFSNPKSINLNLLYYDYIKWKNESITDLRTRRDYICNQIRFLERCDSQ